MASRWLVLCFAHVALQATTGFQLPPRPRATPRRAAEAPPAPEAAPKAAPAAVAAPAPEAAPKAAPKAEAAPAPEVPPAPAAPLGSASGPADFAVLGPPAAASEPGYERWISSQLRTNRIQDATRGLKDRVLDALRRPDAEADLSNIGRDLDALVTSGNAGVTEKARSTLLVQQAAWEELLPVRAAFPRFARFVAAAGSARGGLPSAAVAPAAFERETRLLGPLLSAGSVWDVAAEDSTTLRLTTRFGGGWFLRCLGVPLPLPRLGSADAREVAVLYLEADLLVAVDRRSDGDALLVYAAPQLRGFRSPLGLRAKLAALRARRRERAARTARLRASTQPRGAALVGDVAWRDTASAMDVDEARMQRFLDADPRRRENFSVQDMLDGRLSAEDPLGDLISD